MANPLRGEAKFGKHILVYDVNALCEIEDATGFGIGRLQVELNADPSFVLIRTIIHAGLQAKQPGMTLLEAGTAMSDVGLEEAVGAMSTALEKAMPEVVEGDAESPQKPRAKAGNGRRSTRAGSR